MQVMSLVLVCMAECVCLCMRVCSTLHGMQVTAVHAAQWLYLDFAWLIRCVRAMQSCKAPHLMTMMMPLSAGHQLAEAERDLMATVLLAVQLLLLATRMAQQLPQVQPLLLLLLLLLLLAAQTAAAQVQQPPPLHLAAACLACHLLLLLLLAAAPVQQPPPLQLAVTCLLLLLLLPMLMLMMEMVMRAAGRVPLCCSRSKATCCWGGRRTVAGRSSASHTAAFVASRPSHRAGQL
jgi:hypothetical protein